MSYIDGFVCTVPTDKRDEYRRHAEAAAQVFKQYGASEWSKVGEMMCRMGK